MTPSATVRDLLARPGILRSLAVHDVFTALVAEQAGLELLFVGGFGIAASHLGLPDLGFVTAPEMADAVRRMTDRLRAPLIADGDAGHGDLHQVARTVRLFERAGAAGILLEDQVEPKRCGHFSGKQVVPTEEMLLKLHAALDARQNPDFVILARTDARAVEGLDAALERANRYGAAGADLCFVEAPQSAEELARIAREVHYPQLANMLTGGITPILSAAELETLGFKIVVCPVATLASTAWGVRRVAEAMLHEGRVDSLSEQMLGFEELKAILGYEAIHGLRARLL